MTEAAGVHTVTLEQRLAECVSLVKRAAANHDDALVLRALRKTTLIRKNPSFTPAELDRAYKKYFTKRSAVADSISSLLLDSGHMDLEETEASSSNAASVSDDVELYLLHTSLHFAKTRKTCSKQALLASAKLMRERISSQHQSLDVLRARALHTFALIAEEDNSSSVLDDALTAHRLACLAGDVPTQAVTFNLVLRNLMRANQVSEAEKFASKAKFPLESVSNNQQIRHLFYMGRIHALQLDYSDALGSLLHAIRKLPSNASQFKGLRTKLYKLATVVTLLTGELPERAWFSQPEYRDALLPYFDLVKAVREGNLQAFELVQAAHGARFAQDQLATLVQRLYSSVIKTGLKSIGVSYSRISFADVADKLELKESEEALYLCAKAIRDGVLDASWIDEDDCLCSAEPNDVYSTTTEPSEAFQRRITYLLQAHNDAVKAMRFPAQNKPSKDAGVAQIEYDEDDLDELAEAHMEED